VDTEYFTKKELFGLPIIPFDEIVLKFPPADYGMFVALGYQNLNKLRASKYYKAKDKGYELISYISSKAGNFGDIEIGDNCFILDNSTLQPCSKIGNNVTVWSNNILGHHSTIEDHCYIAGHVSISGHTTIGKFSFIGVNATIGHEITIGEECLIGAGSIVTKNAQPKSVFIMPDTPKYRLSSDQFIRISKL